MTFRLFDLVLPGLVDCDFQLFKCGDILSVFEKRTGQIGVTAAVIGHAADLAILYLSRSETTFGFGGLGNLVSDVWIISVFAGGF